MGDSHSFPFTFYTLWTPVCTYVHVYSSTCIFSFCFCFILSAMSVRFSFSRTSINFCHLMSHVFPSCHKCKTVSNLRSDEIEWSHCNCCLLFHLIFNPLASSSHRADISLRQSKASLIDGGSFRIPTTEQNYINSIIFAVSHVQTNSSRLSH